MDGDELSRHLTYSPSSPAFDYHLPLRRVKPLPKRKRSSPEPAARSSSSSSSSPSSLLDAMLPPVLPPPPGPDATAEELIAHAEVLSAQITFQSYFLPSLGGVTDFTRRSPTTSGVETPPPPVDVLDVAPPPPPPPPAKDSREGDDHADQMQQQGNAKKRKVPAHLSGLQMGPDSADVHSAGEEEEQAEAEEGLSGGAERGSLPGANGGSSSSGFASSSADAAGAPELGDGPSAEVDDRRRRRRRGKVLPATMVGLRQKEMLRHRRRQLATALGMPALGDSLALDQALLANYALLNGNRSSGTSRNARLKSRWVRRRASRVVRRHRTLAPAPPSEPTRRIFPGGEFTFTSLSAASERLIATRAEYTVLYDRFEYELARQVDKAAESAKGHAAVGAGAAAKRGERAVRKARAITQSAQDTTDTPAVSKSPSSTKTSGKKKKRSALANASNPHHLRNYVPSRMPNQGHLSAAQLGANTQNLLSALPLRFLSAQIPPRRGNNTQSWAAGASQQLGNPAEEWICPTCEYRLFYGDEEQGYQIGIRNRKKILKRRRRARERAAAAANGSGTGVGVHMKGSGFDDEEDLDIETTGSGLALSQTRLAKVERDKGGDAG